MYLTIKLILVIIIPYGFLPVVSWKLKKNPYADLSFEEKIAHDGYPLEIYEITTQDNYILTIYRIPHGTQNKNITNRSPVLLLHGLGASAEMFVLLGKNRSLAYNMADGGFDVWFLNARGCRKSQRHKYYDLDKHRKYWDFSFHEVAVYDIAANIDFVMEKTKQKVFVIGHSQGNTGFFVLASEKPEYNDKVKMAVSYAPSVKIYIDNPIVTLVVYSLKILVALYDLLDLRELIPYVPYGRVMLRDLCKEQTYMITLCYHVMSIVGGRPSKILDKDLIPVVAGTLHARVAALQLFHFIQCVLTDEFKQYDYGPTINMQVYKNSSPPFYDLKKATAPTAIFYAPKDEIVTVQGAKDVINELPNVYYQELVEYEHFNHIDFLFGKNASELVYQKTVKLFKEFDEEHSTKKNGTKIKK